MRIMIVGVYVPVPLFSETAIYDSGFRAWSVGFGVK